MKTHVNSYDFKNWFLTHRPNSFSRVGLDSLFEYFEEYEDSTGEEIEFDPIGICCEYNEYENIEEFHGEYCEEKYPTIDEIQDYTQVIPVGLDGFIIQCF